MDIILFLNEKNKEIDIQYSLTENSIIISISNMMINLNKKKKVFFQIKKENINKDIVNIEFKNKNPKSPYNLLLSPDSRQLNFLLLSYNFLSKNI